ncbi:hat family dimerization [Fusarium beomiforme]|uniref:Hat family dimerization n=1 Tax=Fusarium beomiforme TaxID=44412 RepID=A0A9P5AA20_9HYPO|nr:hat family dimerization [Fusarium beomiforme]
MESTTGSVPSSPLYQAEITGQFEDNDPDPESLELFDDGLHFIQHSIKYAMSKLDKYRNLMERSVVYWAAMILHPGYGIGFLQLRLQAQVGSILGDFRDYFDRHYAQGNQAPVSRLPSSISWIKVIVAHCKFPQEGQERSSGRGQPIPTDGSRGRLQRRALLQWWLGHKTKFPRLFNMAMDLLYISAMSSENESVLSAAKLIMSSQRNALHWVTVEALQCLRNWARTGAISWAKPRTHQDTLL